MLPELEYRASAYRTGNANGRRGFPRRPVVSDVPFGNVSSCLSAKFRPARGRAGLFSYSPVRGVHTPTSMCLSGPYYRDHADREGPCVLPKPPNQPGYWGHKSPSPIPPAFASDIGDGTCMTARPACVVTFRQDSNRRGAPATPMTLVASGHSPATLACRKDPAHVAPWPLLAARCRRRWHVGQSV
jgi:hypothetical protein